MLGITKELRESRFYQDIKEEVTKEVRESRFYQEMEDEILSRAVLPLLKSGMTARMVATELRVSVERVNEYIKIAQAEE